MSQHNTETWSRHIGRDLFPGRATPYGWTLLAAAADAALRGAYRALGGIELGGGPLWQRAEEGRVYLNTAAVAEADAALRGAAWLGPTRPALPSGFVARLQSSATVRRGEAAVAATVSGAAPLHAQLLKWLAEVRGLRWSQADLLHVMEELEPNARDALQTYFILRAGLPAAFARHEGARAGAEERILEAARGLPTVDGAVALTKAARLSPGDAVRSRTLERYGHRGPGEIGPSAHRWADAPELLDGLAALPGVAGRGSASGSQTNAPRELLALVQAADVAWDALTVVAAASQCWVRAAAREALAAGLIAGPADVLLLELEELKQVATGEWHRGRSAAVQEQVEQRRAALSSTEPVASITPVPPTGGAARVGGSAYFGAPPDDMPPAGAVWLSETPDPGCAPFWLAAGGLVAADPWSPGVIAARALGVPVGDFGQD